MIDQPSAPQSSEHADKDDDQARWEAALRDLTTSEHGQPHHHTAVWLSPAITTETIEALLPLPSYYHAGISPMDGHTCLLYHQSGISIRQAKKIFHHPFQPQRIIDLHHMSGQQGYDCCQSALVHCYLQRQRRCRIICGIGHHSQGRSLMKGIAVYIMRRTAFLLAYQSADSRSGGTGAIDVYLQRPPEHD